MVQQKIIKILNTLPRFLTKKDFLLCPISYYLSNYYFLYHEECTTFGRVLFTVGKLDKVGLVDNRHSNDLLHQFVKKYVLCVCVCVCVCVLYNRPGVAGAVLQIALLLINWIID